VDTSSALIILVSKYGFADVLSSGTVVLDPSRVAAQIVSGIGFLGAGLIITCRGAVHGLAVARLTPWLIINWITGRDIVTGSWNGR
jgi:uncharacterized membrane protein YhiD involved in acid resistance